MGAMKKLDHELSELIESINPVSPMLGDGATNYEARDILLNELLERGWVPPTMARANARRAEAADAALNSIAIALGSQAVWDIAEVLEALTEVSAALVTAGLPDPSETENTAHYMALKESRDNE